MTTQWLTVAQVAERIGGRSVVTIQRYCRKGQLAATKVGDEWRIHPDAVAAFMQPTNRTTSQKSELTARQQRRAS